MNQPQTTQNVAQNVARQVAHQKETLCPSGRPEFEDSQVFGIVTGTVDQPQVNYLRKPVPLGPELLEQTQDVTPTEVFRIASPCQEKQCAHFDGHDCRLAMRVVDQFPEASESLPPCAIRRDCRWWKQEGKAACNRCPQILTDNYYATELLTAVATPE